MLKHELLDYVKRQLGYPTIEVELTDDQINDSIDNALDEIKPWYTVFKYLTIDTDKRCIDLSEYNILEVTDVIKVIAPSDLALISNTNNFATMASNAYTVYPMYATHKYATSRINDQNIHTVISSYAQMYREQYYAYLANLVNLKTAGTLRENISWKFYDGKLYLDTGFPATKIVTIEYIANVKYVEDVEENSRFMRYLKDLSVAFSQLVWARAVGKYSVQGSPTTINFSEMRNEAAAELTRIREEIKTTSNVFYITD